MESKKKVVLLIYQNKNKNENEKITLNQAEKIAELLNKENDCECFEAIYFANKTIDEAASANDCGDEGIHGEFVKKINSILAK